MDMATRHFYARLYRKNARNQMEHPDLTPALNSSVWTDCLGNKKSGQTYPISNVRFVSLEATMHCVVMWQTCGQQIHDPGSKTK